MFGSWQSSDFSKCFFVGRALLAETVITPYIVGQCPTYKVSRSHAPAWECIPSVVE